MPESFIVALISFLGTMVGTGAGILTSAKLTNYRIEQLEKKVEEHNNFARRLPVLEEKIKAEEQKIVDLEKYHK